jgi:tight adherence protein C
MVIAPILCFCAVFSVAAILTDMVLRERIVDPALGRFEITRRESLRQESKTFLWFEPWVDELTVGIEKSGKKIDTVQKNLLSAGNKAPWKPAEFIACAKIEGIGAAALGFVFGLSLGSLTNAIAASFIGYFGYVFLSMRVLKSKAVRRQIKLKRQFAAAIDLMALMMDVGGGFHEAMAVAADEAKGTPLGDELAIVRRDLALGKRDDALRNLVTRTQDEDIGEVVMALIEGQQLGTPLADILRTQASQMRLKRTQWAEKASAESEVALVFPAMLIMLACLILIAAPFVLSALFES